MSDFLFPDVGEGIHEGKLVEWTVHEGDTVKADEVLCRVETDKAVVEIPSPKASTISKLHHKPGDVIKVGEPLVSFADGGNGGASSVPAAATPPPTPLPSTLPTPRPSASAAPEFKRPVESGTARIESTLVPTPPTADVTMPPRPVIVPQDQHDTPGPAIPTHLATVLASPSTRRLAREKGVDLTRLTGSGENGRVLAKDVLAAAAGGTNAPSTQDAPRAAPSSFPQPTRATVQAVPAGSVQHLPYNGRRKAIGEHMTQSHAAPHVTEFAQADVSRLVEARETMKKIAEAKGVKLSPLPLIAKAVTVALAQHPTLNSILDGAQIDVYGDVHLGIAVDAPKGLVVPVVRGAQDKDVLAIAREINALADAARAGTLTLEQQRGSTFSISSIGPLRVQGFTPMLNAPETAILGVGAIQDLPWVVDGQVVARKVVTLSLTFDHRVVDGAEAARFLSDLVGILEEPALMLLGGS